MSTVIAVAGKGGTGKTTLAALLVRALVNAGRKPVLAVDADPNANLAPALGVSVAETVGQVLEEFHGKKLTLPPGMSKQAFLELRLNQALLESRGFDLLTMGRPEGQGCYCSANAVLRDMIERLTDNYRFVMIDNEAGMEHLSRRTTHRIDVLLMVSDPSMKGVRTVHTLFELVRELGLTVAKKFVVINRARVLDPRLAAEVSNLPVPLLGLLPEDPAVTEADLAGRSFLELAEVSPAAVAAAELLEKALNS